MEFCSDFDKDETRHRFWISFTLSSRYRFQLQFDSPGWNNLAYGVVEREPGQPNFEQVLEILREDLRDGKQWPGGQGLGWPWYRNAAPDDRYLRIDRNWGSNE